MDGNRCCVNVGGTWAEGGRESIDKSELPPDKFGCVVSDLKNTCNKIMNSKMTVLLTRRLGILCTQMLTVSLGKYSTLSKSNIVR